MKNKKIKIAIIAVIIMIAFIISPFSKYAESLAVMSVYSRMHEAKSIMAEKNITLHIPGGGSTSEKDWYPFVMTFNADFFSRYAGENNLKLTILYNFPAFDCLKGCSNLYNPQSPYENGFYGAYLITGRDTAGGENPYGFDSQGNLDAEETVKVPRFDFERLVLGDLGVKSSQFVFDWNIRKEDDNVDFLGYEGFSRVEADITVNSCLHRRKEFVQSYLQYGSPSYNMTDYDDFRLIGMKGIIYARYFPEWDTSMFLYVIAKDEDVALRCEKEILAKSILK